MKHHLPLFALAALLGLSQCKKHDPDPLEQLPPATQTGANTFGCLVNGKPWTPKGYNGSSNYSIIYEPNLNNGNFDLITYMYHNSSKNLQSISLNIISNTKIGSHSLQSNRNTRAVFSNTSNNCYWSSRDSATTYRRGTLTITRLDLQAGIISGTFAFTLYQPGCDTIRVTQGRFDKQL